MCLNTIYHYPLLGTGCYLISLVPIINLLREKAFDNEISLLFFTLHFLLFDTSVF